MTDLPVILMAFANDLDGKRYLRDLPRELRELTAVLESHKAQQICQLVLVPNATLAAIQAKFDQFGQQIKVFHYAGHAGPEGLHLESERGAKVAFAKGLDKYLGMKGVQLAFLNGCSTGPQALSLHSAGVDAVIATSRSIEDNAARAFAVRFYQELVNGHPFADAFELASAGVRSDSGNDPRGFIHRGGPTRAMGDETIDTGPEDIADDYGFPWKIQVRGGAEAVARITLPQMAGDPLLGLPPLPSNMPLPPMPYRYLQPFTAEFAPVFFGRGQAIAELYHLVVSPVQKRLILYTGPSGVGKSSVLDAGLLPRLHSARKVLYARRRESIGLVGTLYELLGLDPARATPEGLAAAWQKNDTPARPLVVILDQAEESFTKPLDRSRPQAELDQLLASLSALFGGQAAGSQGRVILGFRHEWLQFFEDGCWQARISSETLALSPLGKSDIVEIVTGPTRVENLQRNYRLSVQSGLAEEIAAYLLSDAGSALAPTLQVLLSKMWETTGGKGAAFTHGLYEKMRSQGILLGDILNQGLEYLEKSQPAAAKSGFGLDLLECHTTELGTSQTHTLNELQARYPHRPDLNETIAALESGYLLLGSEAEKPADLLAPAPAPADQSRRTRLCHDTLAPLVQKKFRESQLPGPRARRLLAARAQGWKDDKTGETLTELQLKLVEEGLNGTASIYGDPKAPNENSPEARCIAASRLEVAQAKERELRTAKRIKVLQYLAGVAAVFAIISAVYSQMQKSKARVQTEIAETAKVEADNKTVEARREKEKAEIQTKKAEEKTVEADDERKKAELQTVEANKQRAESEHRAANANLMLAQNLFDQGQDFEAQKRLLTIPDKHRTFPWGLLKRQLGSRSFALSPNHTGPVNSVAWSADGRFFASGSSDKELKLWDSMTGKLIFTLEGHSAPVTSVSFSPDSIKLATGFGDNTIRLWEVATAQQKGQPLVGHQERVTSVSFSPDGKTLASGSLDKTIRLWDVATGQPKGQPLAGHQFGGWSVSFSPDGQTLASGFYDKTIRLWDVAKGKQKGQPLTGHQGEVLSVSFSPDGKTLASVSVDNTIRLWDVATGQPKGQPLEGHQNWVVSVSFSPDGQTLASGSEDKTIRLWDVATGQPKGQPLAGYLWPVRSVSFSPDGQRLASGALDGTVRLWDVAMSQPKGQPLVGHQNLVISVSFSTDGQTLASGSNDNTIRFWDVATGQQKGQPLEGHQDRVLSVSFSPDGQTLASGSEDKTIRLWDVATGQQKDQLLAEHPHDVRSVLFSPDGKTLASGLGDKLSLSPQQESTIRLWDVFTGQQKDQPLVGHQGRVASVSFSPDGKTLASGSYDRTIRLWDVATGQQKGQPLERHHNGVNSVSFSPDGKTLASGSWAKTIHLWDVATGQPKGQPLEGHQDSVESVTFSPEGQTLASGSRDNTIRLWDVATGAEVRSISYESSVNSVAFGKVGGAESSPKGRLVVGVGNNIYLLDTEFDAADSTRMSDQRIARNFLKFYPLYDEAIAAIRINQTLSNEEKDRIAGIIQPLIDAQHAHAMSKSIPIPENVFQP